MDQFYDALEPGRTEIRVTYQYPHENGTDMFKCLFWFPTLEKALKYINEEVSEETKEEFNVVMGRRLVLLPSGEDIFPLLKTIGYVKGDM